MSAPETLPVAVVGVGRMGGHHVRHYAGLEGAGLVAVVDGDEARAASVAAEYGCRAFPSVEALLEGAPEVRAVSVATPTVAHRPAAETLLKAGVACLIEKPLAPSAEDGRAIAALAEERGLVVAVGHTERFNPVVRAMADLDLSPRFVETHRVSPMTFRSIDVGVVFDLMIHDLDIVLALADSPLVSVSAVGVNVLGAHEDVCNARLEFASGCVATLTVSRLALKTERKLRVFADDAYVTADYGNRNGLVLTAQDNREKLREVAARMAAGEDLTSLDWSNVVTAKPLELVEEDPLRAELAEFLEAVRGNGRPRVDAHAGCAAVEAAERVVAAMGERLAGGGSGSWGG
jgi:predicted dehydrogenase